MGCQESRCDLESPMNVFSGKVGDTIVSLISSRY